MSLGQQLAPHLPFLRRFGRSLFGDQSTADKVVRATLDGIVDDPKSFPRDVDARLGLYRLFLGQAELWNPDQQPQPRSGRQDISARRMASIATIDRQALLLTAMEGFSTADTAYLLGENEELVEQRVATALAEIERQTRTQVLIIEDEPIVAMDLSAIVNELGHKVTGVAVTRDEAVALAIGDPPGLILADIALADDSSGIDAIRDIVSKRHAPVIFVTAYPERLLTGNRVEPTFLVTKPFQRSTLKAAISQAIFFNEASPAAEAGETNPTDDPDKASLTPPGQPTRDEIAATANELAKVDLTPLSAAAQIDFGGEQLVIVPAPDPNAIIGVGGTEGLRRQHHDTAVRLVAAMEGSNLGLPFTIRLNTVERTLATTLDEAGFISLGVQVEGLRTMVPAIREQLDDDRAADLTIFMDDVRDLAWMAPAYRHFVAEARSTQRLNQEGKAALVDVARVLETQDDATVSPALRAEIAAARVNAQEADDAVAELNLRRLIGNVFRASGRFVQRRRAGIAEHLWPTFDKELGQRLGKVLAWSLVAGAGALVLAQLLPAEFAVGALLTRLVKLLLD